MPPRPLCHLYHPATIPLYLYTQHPHTPAFGPKPVPPVPGYRPSVRRSSWWAVMLPVGLEATGPFGQVVLWAAELMRVRVLVLRGDGGAQHVERVLQR
jgi:hypothetical protein